MDVVPTLSNNAIERMFSGEEVNKPVLQIIDKKLVDDFGVRCLFVLSDGDYYNDCYMDSLNDLQPWEIYTILQIDEYRTSFIYTPSGEKKFRVHVDAMTLLHSGTTLNQHIGAPLNYRMVKYHSSGSSDDTEASIPAELRLPLKWKLAPSKVALTNNVLLRIMAGELIEKPVVQILDKKIIPFAGIERLRLFVTDGRKTSYLWCSHFLTRMHEQLEQLTIIQLDNYETSDLNEIVRFCQVNEITGLNMGSEVCLSINLLPRRASLSGGFIVKAIVDGAWVHGPIVQILSFKNVVHASDNKVRMRLVISDGESTGFAYLSTQLTYRLTGILAKRSIVRLDNYKANHARVNEDRTSITVIELTLLNYGCSVSFEWNIRRGIPLLSSDFIERLLVGDKLEKPVVQVMKVKRIFNATTNKNTLRLQIFDGNRACFAFLHSHFNCLHDEFHRLPTIQLNQYKMQRNEDETILIVSEMTGLRIQNHPICSPVSLCRLPILEEPEV